MEHKKRQDVTEQLTDILRKIRNRFQGLPAAGFDLKGEKLLDWSWVLANLPHSPGLCLLDIGCSQAPVFPTAFTMGYEVTGVDTEEILYNLPGITFYKRDFLDVAIEIMLAYNRRDSII